MLRKTSIFKIPQCSTRSALDKNFNANASSRKPKITFVVLSHPPDFGSALSMFGNVANKAKGRPKARPNPPIPAVSCRAPPSEESEPAKRDPRIGPVHENDTIESVSAMKKTPKIQPKPYPLLVTEVQLAGNVSS